MDPGPSNVIAQGFLKGAFDVLNALLAQSFHYDTLEVSEYDPDKLAALGDGHPAGLFAAVRGAGGVVLLLRYEDVLKIVRLRMRREGGGAGDLDPGEQAALREIGKATIEGGLMHLAEKFGTELALENFDVSLDATKETDAISELLGKNATVATFQFSAGPIRAGDGVLLFSGSLEQRVPEKLVRALFGEDEAALLGTAPTVSDEEMKDILSGFSPKGAQLGEEKARPTSENLGVILDIELTATARLGRVEMPIGEILNLGPGSIIEIDKLVDEPVELLINNKLIARGDVVVVDEKFGLRITEVLSRAERIESLR